METQMEVGEAEPVHRHQPAVTKDRMELQVEEVVLCNHAHHHHLGMRTNKPECCDSKLRLCLLQPGQDTVTARTRTQVILTPSTTSQCQPNFKPKISYQLLNS